MSIGFIQESPYPDDADQFGGFRRHVEKFAKKVDAWTVNSRLWVSAWAFSSFNAKFNDNGFHDYISLLVQPPHEWGQYHMAAHAEAVFHNPQEAVQVSRVRILTNGSVHDDEGHLGNDSRSKTVLASAEGVMTAHTIDFDVQVAMDDTATAVVHGRLMVGLHRLT